MNKRVFREIKSNLGRYIALFILTTIAVGMYVGFISGTNSAKDTFVKYLDTNKLEDGYFTLNGAIDEEIKSDVENLEVLVYENFYVDYDASDASTVRVFDERKDVDLPYVKSGELPEADNDIFIEQIYAAEKELEVGDTIELEGKEYKISGIGTFPDYTISLENMSQMLADRSTFGVAMVTEDTFANLNKKDVVYNYAFLYEDELTDSQKKEKIREIVKTLACVAPIQNYGKLDDAFKKMSNAQEIKAYSGTESNKRISTVTSKMDSNKSMATIFVGIVVIIIAFLYVIFAKQTIYQECNVLGTLMALGIRKGEILISYIIGPCLVTLLGSTAGVILGAKKLYILPISSLSGYYSIPECSVDIDSNIVTMAIVFPVALIILINVIGILKNLYRKPLQLIRRDLKKNRGARKSHLNIGSFDFRFRCRMFSQSIGVYLLLFVGIFLGGWLMMFGVGMSSSFDGYIEEQEKNAVCNYQYAVLNEYEAKEKDAEQATVGGFDYYQDEDGQSNSISGIGVAEDSKYFKELPEISYGEIVISEATAQKFNLSKNDVISLENSTTGVKNQYRIIGVSDYNLGLCVFTSQKEMNNILRKKIDYHNYYFSNTNLDIQEDTLVSETTVEDYVANGKVIKDAMKSMIIMFPIVAVIIYLIIMYILIKLVISQNEIGISMLKVFGFTEKEIRNMYIRTNTIVTVIIILVALPLQYMIMVSMWPACIKTIPGYVDFIMKEKDIAIIAVTGIICYVLANFTSLRKVKKVPMVIALKNQDV